MKWRKEKLQEKMKNAAEWLESLRLLFSPECCYDTARYLKNMRKPP